MTQEFHGYKDNSNVLVIEFNGKRLDWCLDVNSVSPSGLGWSFMEDAATQSAIAMMVAVYGRNLEDHPCSYIKVKERFLSGLNPPDDGEWALSLEQFKRICEGD